MWVGAFFALAFLISIVLQFQKKGQDWQIWAIMALAVGLLIQVGMLSK